VLEAAIKASVINYWIGAGEFQVGKDSIAIPEYVVDDFSARADLSLVNGCLTAIEIKSDSDSLDRLPSQLQTYTKCFHKVSVVCGPKHTHKVLGMIPRRVGVAEISAGGQLIWVREPQRRHVTKAGLLPHLLRDELAMLARKASITTGGMTRSKLERVLVATYTRDELCDEVLLCLKNRFNNWFAGVRGMLSNPIDSRAVESFPRRTAVSPVADIRQHDVSSEKYPSPKFVIGRNGKRIPLPNL